MSHSTWFIIFITSLIISVIGFPATIIMTVKFGILSSLAAMKKSKTEFTSEFSPTDIVPAKTENLDISENDFNQSQHASIGTIVVNRSFESKGTVVAGDSFSITKNIVISYGNPEKVKKVLEKHNKKMQI